jgi:hypothetical protein
MAWWIKVLELKQPPGRFRLTATSDEDGGGPYALCRCAGGHASEQLARECEEAKEKSKQYG